jgi:cytochrome c
VLILCGFIAAGLVMGGLLAARTVMLSASPESTAALPTAPDTPPPAETFARVFEPCAHCHQIGSGARNATGPNLQDVVGRRAGSLAAYPFSLPMRDSAIIWTPELLDRFIAAPQAVVPGTRMMFGGLDDAARRAALIAFLAAPKAD